MGCAISSDREPLDVYTECLRTQEKITKTKTKNVREGLFSFLVTSLVKLFIHWVIDWFEVGSYSVAQFGLEIRAIICFSISSGGIAEVNHHSYLQQGFPLLCHPFKSSLEWKYFQGQIIEGDMEGCFSSRFCKWLFSSLSISTNRIDMNHWVYLQHLPNNNMNELLPSNKRVKTL